MKYKGFDSYESEPDRGEPVIRSCWECNGCHEHLRDVTLLHHCFMCGRLWIYGQFLDEFATPEELDAFLKEHLVESPNVTDAVTNRD